MKSLVYFFSILLIVSSCSEEDLNPLDYSSVPHIELVSIELKNIEDNLMDSLILTLKVTDREMDLGIESFEIYNTRHLLEYVIDSKGSYVKFGADNIIPPLYKLVPSRENKYDTVHFTNSLKDVPTSFNCKDFEIQYNQLVIGDSLIISYDTLFILRNENYFNLLLKIETPNESSNYQDLWEECLAPYHGRFYFFPEKSNVEFHPEGSPFKLKRLNKYEGMLTYGLRSSFSVRYMREPIRIGCYINDNALNKSNEVTSEYLKLQ